MVDIEKAPLDSEYNNVFPVGSEHSGFCVEEVKNIPDFDLTLIKLCHKKTKAKYFHFAKDDSNNVFSICFRTPPINDCGMTHTLEHIVLSGSRKYPCGEPFMKMVNRSLSTFMNAFTGTDFTFYPFATQNAQDFENLMSVYLDSVFYPNLYEIDFLQEGWRFEEDSEKADKFTFKGVVFNEMKGAYANSQDLFACKVFNALLPSNAYKYESGGIPLEIPNLSLCQLNEFYKEHYHPSNSVIFTYGNLPLQKHLEFINSQYFDKFDCSHRVDIVPLENKWESSRELFVKCSIDPTIDKDQQNCVAASFLLSDVKDVYTNFVLKVLSELLVTGPNSTFYKSLLETKLGSNYCSEIGYFSECRESSFTVGLQGVNAQKINMVKQIIDETIKAVIKDGFSEKRIEAVLQSIELSLRHQTSDFGIKLIKSLVALVNEDVDLVEYLQTSNNISKLRKNLEDPDYMKNILSKYLLDNPHKLVSVMSPDENFQDEQIKAEEDLVLKKLSELNNNEIKMIKENCKKLKERFNKEEDSSCLPTLKISDIPVDITAEPFIKHEHCGNSIYIHEQPTNGIVYFKAVLGIPSIPTELNYLVPLFCKILTSMGAGKYNYKELDEEAKLVCSGLSSGYHIARNPHNKLECEIGIELSSHALARNFYNMMDLWECVINDVKFDDYERFKTLLRMTTTEFSNSITGNGHLYAMSSASSYVDNISKMKDEANGLRGLQNLLSISEKEEQQILSDLKKLREILLNKSSMRIALNLPPSQTQLCLDRVKKFLDKLTGSCTLERIIQICDAADQTVSKNHHVFPFPVNYAARSISCVQYDHPDSGPLRVLARLMYKYLIKMVREKGGAYGGGSEYSPGHPFSFFSYRDPHSLQTFNCFDNAISWVIDKKFTDQDLVEAKLGVFQKLDAPVSAGSKGMKAFLENIPFETFKKHRLNVLNATFDNVVSVAKQYLLDCKLQSMCLIGPENEAIVNDSSWSIVKH